MEKASYNVGDLVQLKSGGPVMTVQAVDHHNDPYSELLAAERGVARSTTIHCQWFSGSKLAAGHFPIESLKRAQEKKK